MKNRDMLKLVAAVAMLAAAGVLIAWHFGLFSPAAAPMADAGKAPRSHPGGGARVLDGGK